MTVPVVVHKGPLLGVHIPAECWDLILSHVSSQQAGCLESREKVWMGVAWTGHTGGPSFTGRQGPLQDESKVGSSGPTFLYRDSC